MQPGSEVQHAQFGYGTIISISGNSATVAFGHGNQNVATTSLQEVINS